MVMHRKGQVFLMAAIIIAGLIFALTKISNKGFARQEPEAFYDLADEIGFETKRVLDYGVISGQQTQNAGNVQTLLNKYAEYVGNEDVVFIYGDASTVSAIYYQTLTNVNAISLGSIGVPVPIVLASNTPVEVTLLNTGITVATVRVRGQDYIFTLKPGQNFYFVLIKEEEGEQFVTVK